MATSSKRVIFALVVTCLFTIFVNCLQSDFTEVPEVQESSNIGEQTNVQLEENNEIAQTAASSVESDIDDPDKICVDCIFSLGIACRPSGYLRDFNLRFQAAPLDWMSSYSLDTAAYLFETKFSDFFAEIEEVSGKTDAGYRSVNDTKNHISSIHHFKNDAPLLEEQKRFREKMLNRANKVDEILKNSSSIAFICDRSKATPEELISFLTRFDKIYPNKKIILINIKNSNIQDIKKDVLFENDNLKIIQFSFNDQPSSGDSSDAWKGNKEIWSTIIKPISLSGKFVNSSTDSKIEF